MKPIVIALAGLAICGLLAVAGAGVPRLVNYQGILTDSVGDPIDGTHKLTFKIYPDTSGMAVALWTEVHPVVDVDQGLFNVILGSVSGLPESIFVDAERWLGIAVDLDPEMAPRMRITSVPWAYRAAVAETAHVAVGSGDGHSLDAADGSPEDVVYVDDDGFVGIAGAPITGYELHLNGKMMLPYTGGVYVSMYKALGWDGGTGSITLGTTYPGLEFYAGDTEPRMMIDPDTGNIGIATETPSSRLEVAGDIEVSGPANAEKALRIVRYHDDVNPHIIKSIEGGNGGLEISTYLNGHIVLDPGGTGKVGVGTSTPVRPLDVNGTARMTGFWLDSGGADGFVLTSDATGVGTWQPAGAYADADWTIAGDDMYAAVPGYVGIGTTSPEYLFNVVNEDDASFTRAIYGLAKPVSSSGQQVWAVAGETRNGNAVANAGAGVFGYASHINGGSAGVRGDAIGPTAAGLVGRATHTTGRNYGVLAHTGSPNGYAGYFEGGRNYFEGAVGIGTDDPGAEVEIYGDTNSLVSLSITNPNTGSSSSEAIYFNNEDGSVAGIRFQNSDQMTVFNNRPSGYISWSTGGLQRMEITHNGDVGIGTGSPDEKLHVAGSIALDDTIFGDRAGDLDDLKVKSNDDILCYIEGSYSGAFGEFAVYSSSYTASPSQVFSVNEVGDMWAAGTKSAKVRAGAYGDRLLYAIESPGVWFEDFGSGMLSNGTALVAIDPLFAETVNLSEDYHVFLTPVGQWAELYVAEKSAGSFEVRAAGGSTGAEFSYRLVARRKGYENVRLEEVTIGEE